MSWGGPARSKDLRMLRRREYDGKAHPVGQIYFRFRLYSLARAIFTGPPSRFTGVYCPQEEATCCNKRVKQKPGTSSGRVRPFPQWMNPVTPPHLSNAESAGGGSAQLMPRMKTGTPAFLRRATKAARVSWRPPPASAARQLSRHDFEVTSEFQRTCRVTQDQRAASASVRT